jgi:putative flippase GtrA
MFVQLFRYAIVVGIAFPIDFGLLYFFTEHLHMHYLASTILAFTISMLVNFIISILWVFKARADRPLWKEITAFFIIGFVGLGLTAAIVWLCTSVFGIYYLVSKLIAVSIVFFWSFGARRLMFMKHSKEYLSLFGKIFKKGSFVRSPAFIMFLISLVIFCLNLVLVYKLRPFNSDDVFWQAILLNWKPFDGTTVTLGNSSVYVDKIPFYQFINLFTEPGRKELFIQSAISAVLGFTGFYWASIYFVKRVVKKIRFTTLLPFVWIASFGYSLASLYLNPNWRGFQLGFSLALFALIAAYWSGSVSLRSVVSKCILVAVVLFAGLQLHSDPYFLYFTLAPLTVFSFIMYFYFRKIQRQAFIITLASIATTYLVSKAFAVITAAAGIKTAIAYPMQFISFEKLNESLESTAQSLLKIFNADFSEMEITSQVAIPLTF